MGKREKALKKIAEVHSPIITPRGLVRMGSKPLQKQCSGCEVGDPFLDTEWPCETRKWADWGLGLGEKP
ncbi:hypothetical protein SEA_LUCKYLEO_70 [Gordonia phage LuckyLeo]|nr:hypothetical protein SEA_LUCKYLEO_70 [Gordonia phage LuckyLeo]